MSGEVTDFNKYSHGTLRSMVEALNSGDVMSASDPWRRASDVLKQIRTALNTASGDATSTWEGSSSDAFYESMTKLANSVNNTAAYANDAANTLKMMSEAIDQAKHDMPEEPGFWDKLGNAISDTAQNAVGVQDDSTQIPIADQRKTQAVAVMQTLANKYRAATPVLKPPPSPNIDNSEVPPPDPTASAALSAFVLGSGLGAMGGYTTAPEAVSAVPRASGSGSSAPVDSPRQRTTRSVAATDSGITGGVANVSPKAPQGTAVGALRSPGEETPSPVGQAPVPGSGTSLDGITITGSKPSVASGGGVLGTTPVSGRATNGGVPVSFGGVVGRGTPGGARPSGGAFTGEAEPGTSGGRRPGANGDLFAGESGEASSGRGTGVARRGAARRSPGVIGEGEGEVVGRSGGGTRKAFTEGGSGIGARGRAQAEYGGASPEEPAGFLPGSPQETRRKKKRKGERADYLVEDEETWVSGEAVNPDVVE
ncbi:WXG100 family type VII secretion target [Kitasatospora azatica]|uniref:WXG100 family type VII secretion target n=1 Tax=Kitasatospora azatica TaxID=58347 RepID=UPI000B02BB84|nr:WXG100 family type VII secretion target [Kitasatospora azatica]